MLFLDLERKTFFCCQICNTIYDLWGLAFVYVFLVNCRVAEINKFSSWIHYCMLFSGTAFSFSFPPNARLGFIHTYFAQHQRICIKYFTQRSYYVLNKYIYLNMLHATTFLAREWAKIHWLVICKHRALVFERIVLRVKRLMRKVRELSSLGSKMCGTPKVRWSLPFLTLLSKGLGLSNWCPCIFLWIQ